MLEVEKAAEKLKEASADNYINKNAYESIAKSMFSDFETTLLVAISAFLLKNQPDKEDFLKQIKFIWETRAKSIIRSDFQRFEELVIKQNDEKVLPDTIKDILNNYKLTLETAMQATEKSVDIIIDSILGKNKENSK